MKCLVCGTRSDYFGTATVLKKYNANYHRCSACGLVFVPEHPWLSEAYANAEAVKGDTWREVRNIVNARIINDFLVDNKFIRPGKFLDFGSGDGQFVRAMRVHGFDFLGYDKYYGPFDCRGRYDLITCFEVLEHLEDPLAEFARMAALSDVIIASTDTIAIQDPPLPPDWHYYACEWGQHITLFTEQSLCVLASNNNMVVKTVGARHVFTKRGVALDVKVL